MFDDIMMKNEGGSFMFCKFCGKQIEDNSLFCPYCGVSLGENSQADNRTEYVQQYVQPQYNPRPYDQQPVDSGSFGWAVLGFFFPIVGLVLYLVWKDTKPRSAKKAGIGALVSVIISVILYVLEILVIGSLEVLFGSVVSAFLV